MNHLSEYHLYKSRQKSRLYDTESSEGVSFLVTVNSNKAVDVHTGEYRHDNTVVNYDTTLTGIRKVGQLLNRIPTNPSDRSNDRPKIKNYSVEIGGKNLRLHTHFYVYVPHSIADANGFKLNRDEIEGIFKEAWNIDDNIYVNIRQSDYSHGNDARIQDYINLYVNDTLNNDTDLRVDHKS